MIRSFAFILLKINVLLPFFLRRDRARYKKIVKFPD